MQPAALQRRLPEGWELAPYDGDELREKAFKDANMLLPFHEVFAARSHDGTPAGLPQVSYVAFISQARKRSTGALGHVHWLSYTEDPAGVPEISRRQTGPRYALSVIYQRDAWRDPRPRDILRSCGDREIHLSLA
jgi:hypothetical protein